MAARHDVSGAESIPPATRSAGTDAAGRGRRRVAAIAALLAGLGMTTASAYDQPTHIVLSQQAFASSIMSSIEFEYGLGAFGINDDGSISFLEYPDSTGLYWDLEALVQMGSYYEDEGTRSLNHFFNPVNGKPLSVLGIGFHTSPDWALEDDGQISGQDYSFADARQYYWQALTATGSDTRSADFGHLYQALGQVIHHIQDMAQPQHARDEAHCDARWGCLIPGAAFGFYHPSVYEAYMLDCTIFYELGLNGLQCPSLSASYAPVFDQANPDTYGLFPLPRSFWTESGTQGNGGIPGYGIAEYTNAGFVGARTNFKGTPQALLPNDPNALPLPNGTGAIPVQVPLTDPSLFGPDFPIQATMTFIETPVSDLLTGMTTTNTRASAYSIFDNDLTNAGDAPVFSVNLFTYSTAGALLVPRAIGYSAGLLNYFFRGKLGISLPHEGVYGIVDQAQQYSSSSSTNVSGNTQGFHTIKVALTNASPDGEAMANGTLVAILRYRRNSNYVDTLQGDPGAPGNGSLTGDRGPTDEVIVSTTVKDAGGNVLGPGQVQLTGTPQEFEFDFDQALPLNSTDVYLEIAYQGDLGAETGTAVVSSTIDLSEPTYINIFNALDYISIAGQYWTRDQVDADPNLLALVQPQSCVDYTAQPPVLRPSCFSSTATIPIYLDAHNKVPSQQSLIWLDQLPAQRYARLAMLTNAFGPAAQVTLNNASTCNLGSPSVTVSALDDEIAIQSVDYTTDPATIHEAEQVGSLSPFRSILGWVNYFCVWDGDGSASATGDPTKLAPLSGSSIYPVPVHLTFPQPQ